MIHITDVTDVIQLMRMMELMEKPENTDTFSPEQYLQRGEQILSLLREKIRKENQEKPVLSVLFPKKMQGSNAIIHALKRIQAKIAEPALQETVLSGSLQHIRELYSGVPITVSVIPEQKSPAVLIQSLCRQDDAVGIEIRYTQEITAITCLNYPVPKKYRHKNVRFEKEPDKPFCYIVSFAEELTKWILISQVIQYLKGLGTERDGNVVEEFLSIYFGKLMDFYTKDGILSLNRCLENQPNLISWLEEKQISYYLEDSGHGEQSMNYADTIAFDVWHEHRITRPEFLRWKYLPAIITNLFCQVYAEYRKDIHTRTFLHNMHKEYSHVYETKKDIPNRMLRAMETSGFNDFFGYVEFDSECSLDSIKEIELEFRALQTVFSQGKHPEVSLRFRKLGHYKAAGLYFPFLKCLCVDVRTPYSMAHEYLHMIDHEYGRLSRKAAFQPLYEKYVTLLEEAVTEMKESDSRKVQWNGNTKYNKAYFTEPTEVFARCGEIYLTVVRNVHNSICKPAEDFVYPKETGLITAIKKYFDRLFERFALEKHTGKGEENETGIK